MSSNERELIRAAVDYIRLRNEGRGHSSDEGKRLNAAVKAFLNETVHPNR